MDPSTVQIILGALLGSGGLAGLITAVKARRSRKKGVPGDETTAKRTADWDALNRYWATEINTLRNERERDVSDLKKQLENQRMAARRSAKADAEFIDALEEHIWLQRPAPPPKRKGQE
jgi:leucyl-tRNA synthetase